MPLIFGRTRSLEDAIISQGCQLARALLSRIFWEQVKGWTLALGKRSTYEPSAHRNM